MARPVIADTVVDAARRMREQTPPVPWIDIAVKLGVSKRFLQGRLLPGSARKSDRDVS